MTSTAAKEGSWAESKNDASEETSLASPNSVEEKREAKEWLAL
jgi:hypothetical protein